METKKKFEVFKCKARKKGEMNWGGILNGQTTQLLEVYDDKKNIVYGFIYNLL